jgi:hypothetical protein
MARAMDIWEELTFEQRLAGAAALALFASMFLPWYQQNAVVTSDRAAPLVSQNLNAWAVFSFVEAAVLLVAIAVLALLIARGERRDFHLPGSDGAMVMLAGLWVAALLVWRLFDKPGIGGRGIAANVGIQWGIFFALGAAAAMTWAGARMRAANRPEPPFVRRGPPAPAAARRPEPPAPRASLPPEPPTRAASRRPRARR